MDGNTAGSILNMKEDLIEDAEGGVELSTTANKVSPELSSRKAKHAKRTRITAETGTMDKLIASAAKKLGSTTSELSAWLSQTPNTPQAVQQNALRLITQHGLDPFADEIAIIQYEDARWQAFITIDGWSKLINSHPSFSGIGFTESEELVGGVPTWMGCAIYRSDRVVPIEVKEYLCEIKTEHSIWKEMPRRMLRHRVIAQCARLAFGVSVPEQLAGNRPSAGVGKKAGFTSVARRDSQSSILKAQLKGEVIKS